MANPDPVPPRAYTVNPVTATFNVATQPVTPPATPAVDQKQAPEPQLQQVSPDRTISALKPEAYPGKQIGADLVKSTAEPKPQIQADGQGPRPAPAKTLEMKGPIGDAVRQGISREKFDDHVNNSLQNWERRNS